MPDLKLDITLDLIKTYKGKYGGTIKGKAYKEALTPFVYKKTAKVEDETLKADEVEKEFTRSAEGILHSIFHIVDAVIIENDKAKKDKKDEAGVAKQIAEEITPYRRHLLKLMNSTIDELGGNDTSEEDDGKWQKSAEKYLQASDQFGGLADAYVALLKALAGPFDTAPKLASGRAGGDAAKQWEANGDAAETAFIEFERASQPYVKDLKAKPPKVDAPKKPAKESPDQKKLREAKEALAKSMEKVVKAREEVTTALGEVTTFRSKVMAMLRAEMAKFKQQNMPDSPALEDTCGALAKATTRAINDLDVVQSLEKKK